MVYIATAINTYRIKFVGQAKRSYCDYMPYFILDMYLA